MLHIHSKYHKETNEIEEEARQVEKAKKHPESFEVLYNKYHEPIFRYIYQRMDDKHEAADVASQVFLKAMLNLHKYQYKGLPFSSWLYRIAHNETVNYFRKKQVMRTVNIESSGVHEIIQDMEPAHDEEMYRQVIDMITELDEEDLSLVEMRYFEKRPFKEIGEITGLSENYAKVKVYRIIEKLRKKTSLKKPENEKVQNKY